MWDHEFPYRVLPVVLYKRLGHFPPSLPETEEHRSFLSELGSNSQSG